MAAVFRTLVSSQEPVKSLKEKPSTSNNADDENKKHASSTRSMRFNPFRRRKKDKRRTSTEPDTTGLRASRAPSEEREAPMYFNHPAPSLEARDADRRGNRESYLPELQRFARDTIPPNDEDKEEEEEDDIAEITDTNVITSPKSFFDDDSDDEESAPRRLLKKSFSNLKVGNFLARSRAGSGRVGGSEEPSHRNVALGISGIRQSVPPAADSSPSAAKTPTIGPPTGLRRFGTPRDWADLEAGRKSRSPALATSPSASSLAAGRPQKKTLGKMPSTSDLGDWFGRRARPQETTPTKRHPREAEDSSAVGLRGQSPVALAREQRRRHAALSIIAERSANPSPGPGDAAEEDDERVSDSSSFYLDDAEADALPAPLTIVKQRDQQHLRAPEDGVAVPSSSPAGSPAVASAEIAPLSANARLRADFGLPLIELAREGEAKHPRHPLKWDTQNLMCTSKHHHPRENPSSTTTSTSIGSTPQNPPANAAVLASAQRCALCTTPCCQYIRLLTSLSSLSSLAPTTHMDITTAQQRLRALAQVQRLQQECPNGLDPYDTFVACGECGREVCPGCAGRCGRELCGMGFCVECGGCGGHE